MLLVSVELAVCESVPPSVRLCAPEIVVLAVREMEFDRLSGAALVACKMPPLRVSKPVPKPPLFAVVFASCNVPPLIVVAPVLLVPEITSVPLVNVVRPV